MKKYQKRERKPKKLRKVRTGDEGLSVYCRSAIAAPRRETYATDIEPEENKLSFQLILHPKDEYFYYQTTQIQE